MTAGTIPPWHRDEVKALLRPRGWVVSVLVTGSVAAAGLLAFGSGDPELAAEGVLGVLLLEGVGLALLLTEGVVARDVRRGWAVLWLQKPVSPVGFYFLRWLRAVFTLLVLLLATAGVAALLFGIGRGTFRPPLEAVPVSLLFALTVAVVVFGLSAWRAHPDVLMALGYLFLSTPLAALATVSPEMFGVLGPWIRGVAPPVDPIIAMGVPWFGGPPPAPEAVVRVATYLGTWLLLGVAGLLRTTRAPFARER